MSCYREIFKIVVPILNKDGVRIGSIGTLFLLCTCVTYFQWINIGNKLYSGGTFLKCVDNVQLLINVFIFIDYRIISGHL